MPECGMRMEGEKYYGDGVKKEEAYNLLLTKVKTVDEDVNRDTVGNKLIVYL
jgi:hypothetical protein